MTDAYTFNVLEFDQVLKTVAGLCSAEPGAARAGSIGPISEPDRLALELDRVGEAVELLQVDRPLDMAGLYDLSPLAPLLERDGVRLEPEDLDVCRQTLRCMQRIKRRLTKSADRCPRLAALAERLEDHDPIIKAINRTFGPGLVIVDDASPALKTIRRKSAGLKRKIRDDLTGMMEQTRARGYWQDELITQRNDRFVVPLKASHKNDLPGIIHDSSSTGQTVYMEPAEVFNLNNQIGLCSAEERQEILRILLDLTDMIRRVGPALFGQIDVLAELDCIQAKARLARRFKSVRPEFSDQGRVRLRQARHPLLILSGRPVTPVDLEFPADKTTLIISGPNAGGKTAALKNLGLLTLMAYAGLYIPAKEGSILPQGAAVFAAIGDDQALGSGESTYSARLSRLNQIVQRAEPGDLVLIDELGSGTDPAEGAAIALSVIDRLIERRVKVTATTHLNYIKAYAESKPEALNLAVAFDSTDRRPTYQMVYGQPGLSNAFEIAQRLGMDQRLLDQARQYLGGGDEAFLSVLNQLTEKAHRQERINAELADQLAQVRAEKSQLARDRVKLEADREELLSREGERIKELYRRSEEKLTKLLNQAASADRKERERARYGFFEEKGRAGRKMQAKPKRTGPGADLRTGQTVRVAGHKPMGTVIDPDAGGDKVEVRLAGGLRLKLEASQLEPWDAPVQAPKNHKRAVSPGPAREGFLPEVNIIGLRVEEALPRVDKALDDALLTGTAKLNIVHGVGTGTLKRAVREFLVGRPGVKNFEPAPGRSREAVTQVELGG